MIQRYDKLPPDFCGGGMIYCDNGEYCKWEDVRDLLVRSRAEIVRCRTEIAFLRDHIPDVGASAEERAMHKPVWC